MRGEVTNRVLLGCKRHGRPGTHIGGQRSERPGWQANSEAWRLSNDCSRVKRPALNSLSGTLW